MRGINISKAHSEKSGRWHVEFCIYFRAYSEKPSHWGMEFCIYFRTYSEKSHPGISGSALLSVPFICGGCSGCGFPSQIKGTDIEKHILRNLTPQILDSAVISGAFISNGCPEF
jgi:hypothetical protein